MDFIVTPVSLAKPGRPVLGAQEQIDNLARRNFELARKLDAARVKLAKAERRELVWAEVSTGMLDRIDTLESMVEEQALTIAELDLFTRALEVVVYRIGPA
ncbi:hypothetical protein ACFXAF_00360 [Kitasatospora sp. NPDC059463]|uniref:hypothetical protein n=1 Tax=unclassified Kitasatospora TaxID=2633591 RepID=UPI00367C8644